MPITENQIREKGFNDIEGINAAIKIINMVEAAGHIFNPAGNIVAGESQLILTFDSRAKIIINAYEKDYRMIETFKLIPLTQTHHYWWHTRVDEALKANMNLSNIVNKLIDILN